MTIKLYLRMTNKVVLPWISMNIKYIEWPQEFWEGSPKSDPKFFLWKLLLDGSMSSRWNSPSMNMKYIEWARRARELPSSHITSSRDGEDVTLSHFHMWYCDMWYCDTVICACANNWNSPKQKGLLSQSLCWIKCKSYSNPKHDDDDDVVNIV